tara:strand:- start:1160 stop:2308 length:1149 start_codon:yes stop_codon:yes gene_type:complete
MNILKNTFFLLAIIFSFSEAFAGHRFVEVTGRAVIQENDKYISKRAALEDALYLASLKGGAMVSGFSALDGLSNLSEEVVVRPTSGILDYSIINETIADQHYEITIRALVGNGEIISGCQSRSSVTITVFSPKLITHPSAPAWSQTLPTKSFQRIFNDLSLINNVQLINAVETNRLENNRNLKSNNFDYNALTSKVVQFEEAEFALDTKVYVDIVQHPHSTSISNPSLEDYLRLSVNISITDALSGFKVFDIEKKGISFIGPRKTIFRSLNVFSAPQKNNVETSLLTIFDGLADEIYSKLSCQSLKSVALPSDDKKSIQLNLGSNQGVDLGKLALAESRNTPFTVFEVVNVSPQSSTLVPLDKSRDVISYYGKTITFMEFAK